MAHGQDATTTTTRWNLLPRAKMMIRACSADLNLMAVITNPAAIEHRIILQRTRQGIPIKDAKRTTLPATTIQWR